MTDRGRFIGYCTNVHAGADWEQTRASLQEHAFQVKERVSPDRPMPIGLWFSARTVRDLLQGENIARLKDWLESGGFVAYSFNGFPYGDFHEAVVKHRVYRPDWTRQDRLDYTRGLVKILAGLIPEGGEGSISTLPIGWRLGSEEPDTGRLRAAAANLLELAEDLRVLEQETGRRIHIDLEPEPGCLLDTQGNVVDFFRRYLSAGDRDGRVLPYVRVCHDICHSAVMFESPERVLGRYKKEGIRLGKVQISSALSVRFDELNPAQRKEALERLSEFAEDRYLHQTMVRLKNGRRCLHEDLPEVLGAIEDAGKVAGSWRIHFHVPVFLNKTGYLETTRDAIVETLRFLSDDPVFHYEVETYAWNVLPKDLRPPVLAEGIAREIEWVRALTEK